MLKAALKADLVTVGLGPGFSAGEHVDVAIETAWGPDLGKVVQSGATRAFEGEPRPLGGAGRERYVYAARAGRFHTSRRIGEQVTAGALVAAVDGEPVAAPLTGVLRGLAARGARVASGQKVVEVDPRGDPALCFGVGERPRRIAVGVCAALALRGVLRAEAAA
jgi:xanthine dehydrogenase accessory factor